MAERTWDIQELPLLEVIRNDEEEEPTYGLSSDEVGRRAGLDPRTAQATLKELHRAGYIRGNEVSNHSTGWGLIGVMLEEKGRRAVRQWPSDDAYEELIRVLQDRLARSDDEGEKSRLLRLRDALADVGRNVVAAMIYDAGRGITGMR